MHLTAASASPSRNAHPHVGTIRGRGSRGYRCARAGHAGRMAPPISASTTPTASHSDTVDSGNGRNADNLEEKGTDEKDLYARDDQLTGGSASVVPATATHVGTGEHPGAGVTAPDEGKSKAKMRDKGSCKDRDLSGVGGDSDSQSGRRHDLRWARMWCGRLL
jgi:hypothetical protein